MSVRIQLDDKVAYYTNLDFISGRVIVVLHKPETVSSVVVKLEGESRTLITRARTARDAKNQIHERQNAQALEYHKILYRVRQLFPPPTQAGQPLPQGYTLKPGQYEYPFKLKVPFNNMCGKGVQHGGMNGFGGLSGLRLFEPEIQWAHVTKTLPPSWSGIPNMAEIRYYVKVTMTRPGLFKENRRSAVGLRFLPIEPPRPPPSDSERYARRQHSFTATQIPTARTGLFGKRGSIASSSTPPSVELHARLPNPPILTCNAPISMRVFVKKLNQSPENLFLLSAQVQLIGYSDVRAEGEMFRHSLAFVVSSVANINKQLGSANDAAGKEVQIDSSLWDRIALPPTVTPSFETCNISRFYELEVKIGLGYGPSIDAMSPQIVQLPLRFAVQVYSGVAPPPALLAAMNQNNELHLQETASFDPTRPPPALNEEPPDDIPMEAPPSYEDAMADRYQVPNDARVGYSGETDPNAPSQLEEKSSVFGS